MRRYFYVEKKQLEEAEVEKKKEKKIRGSQKPFCFE